ncbi:MAG: ABC transporter ATP-binding protein [Planctomycetota bacterium]
MSDVSLQIPHGVTGLLGPNGSGKSTLIKALLGLVTTHSGHGQVLEHRWPESCRVIRDLIGYLPEDDCYLAGLEGIESITLMAELSGLQGREALRRSHELLDFCGFGEERYRPVESYSTGMRQKLKFAQALVHDPPLLILDEPTTGLDPDQRLAMLRRIGNLAKQHGKSIILSTHILPDVRTVCDHVVILVGGEVRVADSLESLSRPIEPTTHVSVAGASGDFQARIRSEGLDVNVNPYSGQLAIRGTDESMTSRLWAWAAETGTAITDLAPALNSLEQIFMHAAGQTGRDGTNDVGSPNDWTPMRQTTESDHARS